MIGRDVRLGFQPELGIIFALENLPADARDPSDPGRAPHSCILSAPSRFDECGTADAADAAGCRVVTHLAAYDARPAI